MQDELPAHEYTNNYGPDFRLHIPVRTGKENLNSPERLARLRNALLENISRCVLCRHVLPGAVLACYAVLLKLIKHNDLHSVQPNAKPLTLGLSITISRLQSCTFCRMEAAPSVAFHQRAPDLMQEEDVHSVQPEASDAEDMLRTRPWPQHDDAENDRPAGNAQNRARMDVSHDAHQSCQGLLKQEEQMQKAAEGRASTPSLLATLLLIQGNKISQNKFTEITSQNILSLLLNLGRCRCRS